jgi:hypothetical protein
MSKPVYSDDELYELMMECWHLKSDMRPSFNDIHEKLSKILEVYESKRQQLKLLEMEKLYDYSSSMAGSSMVTPMLSLNLTPNNFANKQQVKISEAVANPTAEIRKGPSNSSSLITIVNSNNLLLSRQNTLTNSSVSSASSHKSKLSDSKALNDLIETAKRITSGSSGSSSTSSDSSSSRQSESEDSQYFSGADTSLVYVDGSNMSTTSSVNTDYSSCFSIPALKAANMMIATAHPPSPPPPKPILKLLNVASAAYNL